MSVLDKWLPFRFRRRTADERKAEPKTVEVEHRHGRDVPTSALSPTVRDFFDDPFLEPFGRFGALDRWFGDFSPARFVPRLDVVDEDKTLKVSVELPGMSREDIDVNIGDGVLTIHGEKRNEEERQERGIYRAERFYGYVHRAIPLPADVDSEKAEAKFDAGVLTVRFPKRASAKESGRKVNVT